MIFLLSKINYNIVTFTISEATRFTYMYGDKILFKDYMVRNKIRIRSNNLTNNSSMVHGIE